MNEIFKAIPDIFSFSRQSYMDFSKQEDVASVALMMTVKQFENAFIEVTGHVQTQKPPASH